MFSLLLNVNAIVLLYTYAMIKKKRNPLRFSRGENTNAEHFSSALNPLGGKTLYSL